MGCYAQVKAGPSGVLQVSVIRIECMLDCGERILGLSVLSAVCCQPGSCTKTGLRLRLQLHRHCLALQEGGQEGRREKLCRDSVKFRARM